MSLSGFLAVALAAAGKPRDRKPTVEDRAVFELPNAGGVRTGRQDVRHRKRRRQGRISLTRSPETREDDRRHGGPASARESPIFRTARIWWSPPGPVMAQFVGRREGNPRQDRRPGRREIGQLAVSPDGKRIAWGNGETHLYDVATEKETRVEVQGRPSNGPSFSPDGKPLATACTTRKVRSGSRDRTDRPVRFRQDKSRRRAISHRLSSDGKIMATTGRKANVTFGTSPTSTRWARSTSKAMMSEAWRSRATTGTSRQSRTNRFKFGAWKHGISSTPGTDRRETSRSRKMVVDWRQHPATAGALRSSTRSRRRSEGRRRLVSPGRKRGSVAWRYRQLSRLSECVEAARPKVPR